jgi:hypothetical protein
VGRELLKVMTLMSAACAAVNGVVGPRNAVRPAAKPIKATAARMFVIKSPSCQFGNYLA